LDVFFHVRSLSFSCNLLQMQHYCICLAFEGGVKDLVVD
jgi:type VI protein secretion system component VasF